MDIEITCSQAVHDLNWIARPFGGPEGWTFEAAPGEVQSGHEFWNDDEDYYEISCNPAFRFLNVQIPQGTTVLDARLLLCCSTPTAHYPIDRIMGIAEDDCIPFDVDHLPRTRSFTSWVHNVDSSIYLPDHEAHPDLGRPALGYGWWRGSQYCWAHPQYYPNGYESPELQAQGHCINIASVIQEIIDRPGWAAGNAIGIRLEDDTVASEWEGHRDWWYGVGGGAYAPKLWVKLDLEAATVSLANGYGSAAHLTASFSRYITANINSASAAGLVNKLASTYSRYMAAEVNPAMAFGSINRLAANVEGLSPFMYQLKGAGGAVYPMYIKTQ